MLQSVKDALADAETLREYLRGQALLESSRLAVEMRFGWPASRVAAYLDLRDAGVTLCPVYYGTHHAIREDYQTTRSAARAAFRVVPGLRGDE